MDRQLLRRLNHKAVHHLWLQDNGYGDSIFHETPTERMCYREGKISIIRNLAGNEVTTKLRLYFDGIFPITGRDKIYFGGEMYPVLSYAQFDGLLPNTGTTVVYL